MQIEVTTENDRVVDAGFFHDAGDNHVRTFLFANIARREKVGVVYPKCLAFSFAVSYKGFELGKDSNLRSSSVPGIGGYIGRFAKPEILPLQAFKLVLTIHDKVTLASIGFYAVLGI